MFKQITDFDNYLINEKGIIFSKITNKIIKSRIYRKSVVVDLRSNGLVLRRNVSRLVFITFNNFEPYIVIHIDNNFKNNHLNNLKEISLKEHLSNLGKNSKLIKERKTSIIYCVNIDNKKYKQVFLKYRTKLYDRVNSCVRFKTFNSRNNLYFYKGNKNELIDRLISEINLYNIYIKECKKYYSPIRKYKKQIKIYQNYIDILKEIPIE